MFGWFKKLFKKKFNKEEYMKSMAAVVHKYVDFFSNTYGSYESVVTPWGAWIKISEGDNYKTKIILVEENQKFSLQYHNNRDELWLIISGSGIVTIDEENYDAIVGKHFFIPRGTKHRVECKGSSDLRFIEIQFGSCDENDITRLEDDYNRI